MSIILLYKKSLHMLTSYLLSVSFQEDPNYDPEPQQKIESESEFDRLRDEEIVENTVVPKKRKVSLLEILIRLNA